MAETKTAQAAKPATMTRAAPAPEKMPTGKTLDVSSGAELTEKVSDVKVVGDPDAWRTIVKVSSEAEGWMKSTKVMDVPSGVIIQVTTQQRNPDGTYAIAEALTFIPGTRDKPDKAGVRKLHPYL